MSVDVQFARNKKPQTATERAWNNRPYYRPSCPFMSMLRDEFELDQASFQAPPPPAPLRRPTVRLLDGRKFRGIYFNGTMDGAQPPYFYFTINPRLARLSLPLTLWQEIPGRPGPCSGPGEG